MKLQKLFLAVLVAISTAVFSQQNSGSDQKSQPSSAQLGQSILETERKLDEKIFELNQRLTRHTVLMKMKVRVLPFRTVLFKGKPTMTNVLRPSIKKTPRIIVSAWKFMILFGMKKEV
ncbi:hypothetical protein LEP1GSC137_1537 [Leptospira borgpetersenii str. Noumea 25]|nr:hypothetical protein LEP1GSC137_1537 [Leptospira borgpetersenii str. Noumea 25]